MCVLQFTNWPLMPNCLSYRNATDLFGIASTSPFQPQAPWCPSGPSRPHMGPKPKTFSCGPIIKCHTIFVTQNVGINLMGLFLYLCWGPLQPHMGPQRTHMGPKPKTFSVDPSFDPTIQSENWICSHTFKEFLL